MRRSHRFARFVRPRATAREAAHTSPADSRTLPHALIIEADAWAGDIFTPNLKHRGCIIGKDRVSNGRHRKLPSSKIMAAMDRSIPERRNAAATVKDEAQIAKLTEQDWSNVVSLCSERYHQNPRKLWERLWYRISRFLKLSRKINAINRLTGDLTVTS